MVLNLDKRRQFIRFSAWNLTFVSHFVTYLRHFQEDRLAVLIQARALSQGGSCELVRSCLLLSQTIVLLINHFVPLDMVRFLTPTIF